jgi:8-oxo-dGTP pyrophosphatase MutT (NUDIX family)
MLGAKHTYVQGSLPEGNTVHGRRHSEFASAIIIDTQGRFLLQQRDDVAGILHPGMISLFGGHREGGETFLECVVREIHEETSCFVPPERFEHLSRYIGIDANGGTVINELYIARDVPADAVRVTEGSLLVAERDALASLMEQLTPATKSAVSFYLNNQATC